MPFFLEDLRDRGGAAEIISAGDKVAPPHGIEALRALRAQPADLAAVITVGHDAAAIGVNAGGQAGAVDLRRTDKHRMMIFEEHAVARERIQGRRVLRPYEVRAHPVPNHDYDVLGFSRGEKLVRVRRKEIRNE